MPKSVLNRPCFRSGWLPVIALLLSFPALLRAQAPAWTGAIELRPTGDNATATGQRVATGPNGAVYNAGILRGTATFGNLPPVAQPGTNYLARLDPATGAWLWAAPIGGWGGDLDIVSLEVDPATGNVLVAGTVTYIGSSTVHTFGAITTYGTSFVAGASPGGQWLWALSPSYNFKVKAATWDGAGGVVVAGSFGGPLTLGALSVTATPGSVSPLGGGDGLVAHLSASQQWDALLPLGGAEDEQLTALAYDAASGAVAVGGTFSSTSLTIGPNTLTQVNTARVGFLARGQLTGAGSPVWLGGLAVGDASNNLQFAALRFAAAGQLLVLGQSYGPLTLGAVSVSGSFLARLNPISQQWEWAATAVSATGSARFTGLTIGPGGSVWVGGDFGGTVAFGPQTLTNPSTVYTNEIGFVARLDGATGLWQDATALTGAARWVLGVALDPAGTTLYTTGVPVEQATVAVFGGTPLMGGAGTAYAGALNITAPGAPVWRWAAAPAVGGGASLGRFVRDGQGNLTVTGTYYRRLVLGSTTLTTPNSAQFVAQCTPGGQWRWAHELPPFQLSDVPVAVLATDGAGNVYLGGRLFGNSITAIGPFPLNVGANRATLCVASLDPAGNWRWASTALSSQRGGGYLFVSDLAASSNGYPTITGFFQDSVTFGTTRLVGSRRGATRLFDDYVARLDGATGQWLWAAQVRGRYDKFAKSVAVDGQGNAVMAGFGYAQDTVRFGSIALVPASLNNQQYLLPHVARLSATGQWLTAAGTTPLTPGVGSIGSSVFVATNDAGDALLTGSFTSNALRFGPHVLSSPVTSGYNIAFVARLSGQPYQWQWVRALADTLGRFGVSQLTSRYTAPLPALDAAGNAYLGGTLNAPLMLPGLPAPAGPGPAVLKLDPTGQAQWLALGASNAGSPDFGRADVSALVVTPTGQPLLSGDYSGPVQFGPTTLTRYSYYNGFIAGVGVALVVPEALATPATADLWPNPARTTATLRLPAALAGPTTVRLLDGLGRPVRTVEMPAGATTVALPLTGLAPGLYLVRGAGAARRLLVTE